jgi:Kef-type K+ transport system membrane component KefB
VTDGGDIHTAWALLVGFAVIASGLIEAGLKRFRIPALVGYLLLGTLLSLVDTRWALLSQPVRNGFSYLADLGVIALLFKVGLQSHPAALARKLPQALKVWIGDVSVSALLGFAAAHYLLGLELIPSLIIATALTATSVGVSVAAWQSSQALDSGNGQLLLDVAELDDISAIGLMALLFALLPILHQGHTDMLPTLAITGSGFIARFALFLGLCYLFSRYLEPRLTHFTARLEPAPQQMLTVVGSGFVIAALANWLGFSLAIGALFAGLAFSSDPQAVKTEKSFQDIYAFVTPFFFINIGLNVAPDQVAAGAGLGLVLLIAAVIGKVIGAGIPTLVTGGLAGAALIGVSMIPRAEIAMVVVHQGQQLGDWAMPERIYASMVFVTLVTCVGAPWILYHLLQRWPQTAEDKP